MHQRIGRAGETVQVSRPFSMLSRCLSSKQRGNALIHKADGYTRPGVAVKLFFHPGGQRRPADHDRFQTRQPV
ncbi:hypothetical protein MTBLM5_300008 [Magnetospirillum sp. LM-5]|nr:hypothetical protein MTBLM5_300008 [Magnetospirillum sp. LM-5]